MMLGEFLDSWSLFREAYVVGWIAAALLSIAGVIVVARNQVFLGAALPQASTLGVALAMWLTEALGLEHARVLEGDAFRSSMAVVFSVAAALAVEASAERMRESRDAILGWAFLLSASVSVLIVSHSPHGLEEIHRLVASSIIGARAADVAVFSIVLVAVVGFVASSRRKLLLFVLDRPMAEAVGMRTGRWSALLAIGLGLVAGLSLRATGLLYTFGCLVLPAVTARSLCREIGPMFAVAPTVAVSSAVAGFVLANHYDYPPAQMTVAVQALLVLPAWLARWLGRRQ
jgi:ABC-type Mn2+/Zn2+ transport system permease subunit